MQGDNENSAESYHFRMDDETLNDKINAIIRKKSDGHQLSLKETKTLKRLNRVRASRKFRAKEKQARKLKHK